jgi:hypothetical protein
MVRPAVLLGAALGLVRAETAHVAVYEVPAAAEASQPGITPAPELVHQLVARDGGFVGAFTTGNNRCKESSPKKSGVSFTNALTGVAQSCPPNSYYATDLYFGYCCDGGNNQCFTATGCSGGTATGPNGFSSPW